MILNYSMSSPQNLNLTALEDNHFGSKGDICFHNGQLLSLAEDSLLKAYSVNKGKLHLEQTIELEGDEPHSLSSNSLDKLVIGG